MSSKRTFDAEVRTDLGERGATYIRLPKSVVTDLELQAEETVQVALAVPDEYDDGSVDGSSPEPSTATDHFRPATGQSPPADGDQRGQTTNRSTASEAGPPVSTGEMVDVEIETVGDEGDGIAKIDGYTMFVPNTTVGDEVTIEVTKTFENYGFAEVRGERAGRQ